MTSLLTQFQAARRVSAPILAINTPDPAATIETIAHALAGKGYALTQWDAVRGLTPLDEAGASALAKIGDDAQMAINPVTALICASRLPEKAILFVHNAPRLLEGGDALGAVQAMWNLRDDYKSDGRTLVLLGPQFVLPPELSNDVMVLDEPLPDGAQLQAIVAQAHKSAKLKAPDAAQGEAAVSALLGLAAFPAEQVTAMSLTKTGLDVDGLWERKRATIEATPGLGVWRGQEKFADIGGLHNIKTFLSRVVKGTESPRVFVFIDEIEKALSGAGEGAGDGGVSRDQLGTLLSWMQDNGATGIICIGPPGTSKSMIAKAAGNEAGVPTISLDFGAMKGSLVGQSEQNLRLGLKVIQSMAGGRVFLIATCNSIAVLPPELRRRFTFGTFFFDLPTSDERAQIWTLYLGKYGLEAQPIEDSGWTGAEIKQCCEIAWRLRCSVSEAARYVVPVSVSAVDQVESLRSSASGRFISASNEGLYQHNAHGNAHGKARGERTIELEN